MTPTLRDLFVSTNTGTVDAGLRLPPPPDSVVQLVTGAEWSGMAERVLDLLDINVIDVLVGGWKGHREVRRELRQTRDDPSCTALVTLARHAIESTHTPSLEVRAQGKKVFDLSFPLELTFEIEAVALKIRGGAIREARPGAVTVRGTLKLENSVLLQREHAPFKLPGTIRFDEPLAEPAVLEPKERDLRNLRNLRNLGTLTNARYQTPPPPSGSAHIQKPSAAARR
jgi:hypothetical protein